MSAQSGRVLIHHPRVNPASLSGKAEYICDNQCQLAEQFLEYLRKNRRVIDPVYVLYYVHEYDFDNF